MRTAAMPTAIPTAMPTADDGLLTTAMLAAMPREAALTAAMLTAAMLAAAMPMAAMLTAAMLVTAKEVLHVRITGWRSRSGEATP